MAKSTEGEGLCVMQHNAGDNLLSVFSNLCYAYIFLERRSAWCCAERMELNTFFIRL